MKKLLKLLFVLSGSTTLPLAVVACGQQSLDSILNIIKDGKTKYDIDQVLSDKKIEEEYQKTYSLTKDEATLLAKSIAEKILAKSENKTEIKWEGDNVAPNEKVYSFKITNGKDEEKKKDNYTWTTFAVTGNFNLKISYFVGTINDQKQFNAAQQLNMSFDIKCYKTEGDKIVEKWVANFNKEFADKWNNNHPLVIDLGAKEIDLPVEKSSWSDLNSKVKDEVQAKLTSFIGTTNIGWKIQSDHDSVVTNKTLKIFLSVDKKSVKETNRFYIQFN